MLLLVSVVDPREARAALVGGADVVDAKDPHRGALGAVTPRTLRAICDAVEERRPVSAALGDAEHPIRVERAVQQAVDAGVTYVKVGFGGVASRDRVRQLGAAAARAAPRLILVAYADWERARSVAPDEVLEVAAHVGAAGVLLDTAFKGTGLFELIHYDAVASWVAAARGAGLIAALAGSLEESDMPAAREAGADIAGVRGAACHGGRTGSVSVARVAALSAVAREARPARVGRVV